MNALDKGEIIRSYKQAENKKEQLKVLAELNAVSQKRIIDILIDAGVLNSETKTVKIAIDNNTIRESKRGYVRWTDEKLESLKKYVEEGKSVYELMSIFNATEDSIYNIMSKKGIGKTKQRDGEDGILTKYKDSNIVSDSLLGNIKILEDLCGSFVKSKNAITLGRIYQILLYVKDGIDKY